MNKYEITMIAAIGPDRGIGYQGNLVYKSSADLRWFNRVTLGSTVITGRKTFEEILSCTENKGLPNRNVIVVSSSPAFSACCPPSTIVVKDIEDSLKFAQLKNAPIHIIGGGTIYRQVLPLASRLVLTEFSLLKNADTFFPEFKSEFKEISRRRLVSLGEDSMDTEAHVVTYYRK